ncbi:MAG: hypothetical protein IPL61_27695 [Myxococcales bacterium]|nr:hypothetical protein [Myxococcales bacterium]
MTASLARVAQRYVAAFDAHAAAAGSAAHAQPVTSADLVPSAPMDRLVARVLARDAMVTVTPAGPGQSRAAEHHKTRRIKSLVWLAEPGMWNWVKVLDPADATAEEVAWHLWKDYSAAHRLEVSPPLFGLTAEDAAEFPEARQQQGIVAAGTDAARASRRLAHITGDQATTDRRGQLTHSKAGTEAARGQARAVAPDAEPATPAAAAAAPASTADAYGRVVQILDAIARQVAPMGLGTELAPIRLRAFLSLQRGDGDPAIAAASLPLVIAQERLLAQVAVPIAQLARQGRAGAAPALLDATRDLLRVVALSEHPAVAEAALTEALARQQLASVDSLEALLARATQSVGSLALNPDATRGARRDSAAEFGASLGARHQALRTRVAELRARFTAGEQVSAIEIGDLTTDVETLEVESNILALSGDLPQVIAALTTLSDKVSQIVLGDAGDQVDLAGEGRDLRERLTRIHDHWLNAHRALGKVNKWTDVNLRRELATRSLAELREELADLGGDARVATYLRTAYAAVDDGYTRDALFKIGAMIGVAVISAGAGAVIGGAVGASTVAGQVAAIATETLVNAGLSAAVTGGDFSTELVANAAATAVTLGTLSVAQKALASTRLVKTLAAVRAAGGPDGAAAALAQFALYGVTLTGAVVAGMEADSVARGQGGIGISTLPTQASHGLAMLIGQGIVQRLAHRQIESLRRLGARGREVAASYLRARRLAKRAAAHDDPAATLRAIEAERAAYAADLALHEHLLAHGDLDAAHLTERRAAAIIDENRARIADLDTAAAELAGLQPLIEGHAYRGSAAQVDAAAAQYQHRGYTLEPGTTAAGDRTVTAVSPDGATRIELVATGAAAPAAHERPTDRFPAVDESGGPAHDRTTTPMPAVDETGRPAHERTTTKMHAVDEAGRPTHEPTTAKMHAVGEAGRHARAPDYGSVTAEALAGGYQLPGKEHGVDPEWYYYRDKRSTPGEYELAVRPEAPAGTPRLRAVVEDGAFVRLEVQKARSPATPTPIEPIADERPAPAVDGAEGVRANTPGSPAPVEPATRGRKLPEVPIRKQDFAYTAKPDGAYFRIDYKGRDVRGNEYALGHGKVRVDDVGAPMEYPEFGLHSDADGVNGERIVVRIYDDVAVELARSAPEGEPVGARGVGEPSSLTRLAIDTMVKEYDARWGHPPEALQGHLAWYNKLNFQREYFKFKSAGLSNDDAGIAAIKAISFGAARVDAGYGDFYVKCTGTERVDLGEPYGRQRVPKKIEVMAYRTKEVS